MNHQLERRFAAKRKSRPRQWGNWEPVRYEVRCRRQRADLQADLEYFVAAAPATPDVQRIVVFGSYARGEINPWSDLDLLVVRERGGTLSERLDDLDALPSRVRRYIIVVTPTELHDRLPRTGLGETILREGRVVYERPA
ncbi:MAG: nucleotidyltransferase domain-containing protein [Vulcanimicrobiaceae bacterium]